MPGRHPLPFPHPAVYLALMSEPTPPPVLDDEQAIARLRSRPRPWAEDYLAMYSSWLEGITTSPWLMSLPLDDHMVHRGDGVFEAVKCVAGRLYQWEAHLARLWRSAAAIALRPPLSRQELTRVAVAVVRAGGHPDCLVRIFLSRGPGGFTTNPYECPTPGLYLIATRLHPPPPQAYTQGVEVGITSEVIFPLPGVKSCNYLPNVLLKRLAVDRGWDFAIGLDPDGNLAEGSTENIALVDRGGRLVAPAPGHILEGITLTRCLALARRLVDQGLLQGVERRVLSVEDLRTAREAMLLGTTLDVLPVTRLEGRPLGDGQVGPVARALGRLLEQDIRHNPQASTPALD